MKSTLPVSNGFVMSCSIRLNRLSRARWLRLARLPVLRLSTPITEFPAASRESQRWEPRKPAAPVTRMFRDIFYYLSSLAHSPSDAVLLKTSCRSTVPVDAGISLRLVWKGLVQDKLQAG